MTLIYGLLAMLTAPCFSEVRLLFAIQTVGRTPNKHTSELARAAKKPDWQARFRLLAAAIFCRFNDGDAGCQCTCTLGGSEFVHTMNSDLVWQFAAGSSAPHLGSQLTSASPLDTHRGAT